MRAHVLALALAAASGCSSSLPPPEPDPPIRALHGPVGQLRVHVINVSSQAAEKAGEREVSGFTLMVREDVAYMLARAGWRVVVDPEQPRDIDLLIDTELKDRTSYGRAGLTVSLTARAAQGVVEQLSGVVPIGEYAEIERGAVARLVESLGSSPRLARYAQRVEHPELPCAPAGLTVAAPAAPP